MILYDLFKKIYIYNQEMSNVKDTCCAFIHDNANMDALISATIQFLEPLRTSKDPHRLGIQLYKQFYDAHFNVYKERK